MTERSNASEIRRSRPPDGLLEVGAIRRAHGVKGDTYVDLLTDRDDRLAIGSRLWAAGEWRTVAASKHLPQRWLVHFVGLDDRAAAEALTNVTLHAEPIDDPEALWIHDLIGSVVVELDGTERGLCVGVLANPAHDILELASGALVPVTFVVSCSGGVTTIDPPDGLFELGV